MTHLLLAVIYLSFVSLGLPDALLGAAWPSIYPDLGAPVAGVGALSLLLPLGRVFAAAGLITVGLGCAPVYPCMIHETPALYPPYLLLLTALMLLAHTRLPKVSAEE